MDHRYTSSDGKCTVESTLLREYRMGVFPERLVVIPPIDGVSHFYFMGGHVSFPSQHPVLLLWDSDDVLMFNYQTGKAFTYSGPLRAQIAQVALGEDGQSLDVRYYVERERFDLRLVCGEGSLQAGLGRLSDGIFMSTPASEHPRRVAPSSRGGLLARLFRRGA